MSIWSNEKDYRPNVGVALFNRDGCVFTGKAVSSGPEIMYPGREWQLPQGGIQENEDIILAARRELYEETGVVSALILDVTEEWWLYDFPPYSGPAHPLTPFRGQKQRWVAMRFEGEEEEISLSSSVPGLADEFTDWRWQDLDEVVANIVEYKRDVYARMRDRFRKFGRL